VIIADFGEIGQSGEKKLVAELIKTTSFKTIE
jgi:hypothetical protein